MTACSAPRSSARSPTGACAAKQREAPRRHLRQVRRRGHPGQGAPRAPRPHHAGHAGQPRLVLQGAPSRIGHLLDISLRDLERVLYFEAYVVIEPGDTDLKQNQLLTEEQFRKAREEHGPVKFRAQMGAEAIKELLKRVNVDKLAQELRDKMRASRRRRRS